jgi:hypothetical protein
MQVTFLNKWLEILIYVVQSEEKVIKPLPVTTGYQQSEPANVADVGWGWGV